jgi:carboxyl-terminal processing protease
LLLAVGFCVLLASGLITCSFLPREQSDSQKSILTETVMLQLLNGAHFSPREFNDGFSEDVYDLYIKRLDINKKFFLQSDIDQLKKSRQLIDDEILSGKLDFFEQANNILNQRMNEVEGFYKELLSKPFDYTLDEKIETDNKKLSYPADEKALRNEWRKVLKYQSLVRLSDMMKAQEKAASKKDTVVEIKTFETMEKESREKVEKNYADFFKRLKKQEDTDRLGVYLNTISNAYDPHTEFFAPRVKDNFDIAMSGQLEGIGAQLQERDGSIKVSNIIPGSPSWRQGQLKAGDIILKVAQGTSEPVDITEMRLDEAVTLVRGKKGTEVRLTVRKVDGSTLVIPIIRDVVVLEETYAKSLILNSGKKIGYIKLPSFYADFNKQGGRRCAADMKAEVTKLKAEGIDGLIIDVRNNGGGSLQDVVEIAGLFIPKGPIVQVKSRGLSVDVLEDKDPQVLYDGPLAIMVNNISASASEILAAAMQDYKRGVVIGGEQTFGKGTVQRVFNMDDYLSFKDNAFKPLGSLKLTTQKFYRVNGGATQLKGVSSDIVLADRYEKLYRGEREEEYPLIWDEIKPANIETWNSGNLDVESLKKKSKARVQNNKAFSFIKELEQKYQKQKDESLISLNLETFRKEEKKNTDDSDQLDEFAKGLAEIEVSSAGAEVDALVKDSVKTAVHEEWVKQVKKDFYIREAMEVIKDWK